METLRLSSAVALCALVLGCGGGGTAADTLVFSYGKGDAVKQEVFAELVDRFEADHPDVAVFEHPLPTSTDEQRNFYLASLGAGSNFVDVLETDVIWTSEFAAAGLLADVGRVPALAARDRFVAPLVQQAMYDGQQYGVPLSGSYGAVIYRADLLGKHGFDAPRTAADLVATAAAVGEAEGMDGFLWQGADYEGLACNFLEFYAWHGDPVRAEGSRVVLDLETTRQTLQFMHDVVHEHHITPRSVLGHDELDTLARFAAGDAVFMRNWHGAMARLQESEFADAVAFAPPLTGRGALAGGWLLAVNARSEQPDLAVEFVSFMAGEDAQQRLVQRRGQGPALAALAGEVELPPGALDDPVIRPRSPYYFELSLVITEEVRRVLKRDVTVEQGAEQILSRTAALDLVEVADPGFPETSYMTRYRP